MCAATVFGAALAAFRGDCVAEGAAAKLLAQLRYDPGGDCAERRFREGALRLAAAAEDVFLLNAPGPGGVRLLGLRLHTAGLGLADAADEVIFAGGRGMDMRGAFESCVGEAFERLCLQGREPLSRSGPVPTVTARRLVDGIAVAVAAGDVYRHRSAARHGAELPGSAGCGAAPTTAAAVRSGLMEVVERDAVALWWLGGLAASAPPPAAMAVLDALRPPRPERPAWLLDLTTDLGVPVVAALSGDPQGREIVTASAAGDDLVDAAARAAMELVQMEHAAELSRAKQRAGMPLAGGDRLWLDRLAILATSEFPVLRPAAGPAGRRTVTPPSSVPAAVAAADPEACVVETTIEGYGMHAVRVLAPGLQACGGGRMTARLGKVLAATGHDYMKYRAAPQPV